MQILWKKSADAACAGVHISLTSGVHLCTEYTSLGSNIT